MRKSSLQVVLNVGLCIALHDITRLEDSYIFPGDGAAHTKVNFRYVVFRPFMEEVIIGKIRSCSREGVHGKSNCLT
jgi:DNA-directed RNA polymerase III subunit RPC8